MKSFSQYLIESKNTHMEHIEDLIFNEGVEGTRKAIFFLRDLRDMLSGNSSGPKNITVKWDGAPAIFAGIDPADGKFFVAKKGIFNKNPKVYKTQADIDADLSGDLRDKFTIALSEFSKLGIKSGLYQGDLMFTSSDLKTEKIDGESYLTFQPNTIVYSVPASSSLAAKMKKAKIGVVWHTTYTGRELSSMKASFGKPIVSKMRSVSSVWMDDATYRDVSGTATFTSSETDQINQLLSKAGTIFRSISGDVLRMIESNEALKQKIKTYNNTYVRKGEAFPESDAHFKGLIDYLDQFYDKEIEKRKTEKAKAIQKEAKMAVIVPLLQNKSEVINIFKLMNVIVEAKAMIVAKLNQTSSIGTFLRTSSGFKATSQEGFVAIDNVKGSVKLVDRLEFSRANFSPDVIKGWER